MGELGVAVSRSFFSCLMIDLCNFRPLKMYSDSVDENNGHYSPPLVLDEVLANSNQ